MLVAGHLLRVRRVITLLHRQFLELRIRAGRSVAGVNRNLTSGPADRAPIGHVAGEDLFHLLFGQGFDWIRRVHDHRDPVVGDDCLFKVHTFGLCCRDLFRFGRTARHSNLGRAVNDRGDAGGRSFRGNVEGCTGMLRFKLFRQLWNELGAERVRAFDHECVGACDHRRDAKSD